MHTLRPWLFMLVLAAPAGCGYQTVHALGDAPGPATRDPTLWPFAANSIWNTPIGAQAQLVPAGLVPVETFWLGTNFLVPVAPTDPVRPLLRPGSQDMRCTGMEVLGQVQIPDAFVLSEGMNRSPGNSTALLMPDGRTLVEVSGLSRCTAGGGVYGFPAGSGDILALGLTGGQGGSGLSAMGGALRAGELLNAAPVRHALKVAIDNKHLFYDASNPERCFRWPAQRCDGGAFEVGQYGGSDPRFTMGALLTLPREVQSVSLSLETEPARRLLAVLRDYGAYVVGTAAPDTFLLEYEAGARAVFVDWLQNTQGAWLRDINRILPLLQIVDNNAPETIGGGGLPMAPLAPPFTQ